MRLRSEIARFAGLRPLRLAMTIYINYGVSENTMRNSHCEPQRKYNAQQSLRASAKQSRSYYGKIQNNFILLNILP